MKRVLTELRAGLRTLPRGAVVTVAVGLLLSLLALAANRTNWEASADLEWAAVEEVVVPPAAEIPGGGSIELARTTLSALPRTERGDLLFRVSGVLVVNRPGEGTVARCDVAAPSPAEIARTPRKRAAWPRPSEDLRLQDVPELMVIDFSTDGAELLGLPIRDSFRRYSDTPLPVTVDWDGFAARRQNWVWELPEGSGSGPVTFGFAVVFKTYRRPVATIACTSEGSQLRARAELAGWPVADPADEG